MRLFLLLITLNLISIFFPQSSFSQDSNLLNSAKNYIQFLYEEKKFNGVIFISQNDKHLFKKAYGYADFEQETPLVLNHIFRFGSLTKPFTATAIVTLSEKGLLNYNNNLCEYLAPCPTTWKDVTIEHLLTHTSGIPDLFGDLEEVPVEKTASELNRLLNTFDSPPHLDFTAGNEYVYSNFNYVLLGIIVEKTSGKFWETYLKDEMFIPLQLTSLGYDDVYEILPGRVRGYDRNEDGNLKNIDHDDHGAYAAGGLRGSILDFHKWFSALINGEIISKSSLGDVFQPFKGYGYGWRVRDFFERPTYYHSGGIDGFSTQINHFPEENLTIVVFTNIESDPAIFIACDLSAIFLDFKDKPQNSLDWLDTTKGAQRCGIPQ